MPESLPGGPAEGARADGTREVSRQGMRDDALREHLARVLAANYELEHEIGRGGMGIVYRARDRRLKRAVAVKLLPPDLAYRSDIRSRFLKEAETSAQLSHPSIVPIYTVEEADNLVFFIMGLVHGDTIAKRLHERGPMAPDEVRRALREVADALAYAHARNVVHRDIKPDNVLLDNDTGRAMVTDFGIARAVSEGTDTRLTTTGLAIGTPAYMSPEQCAGDRGVDGRSDLYSLGVLGYQMLSGDLPFAASNTPAMFVKHLTERPRPIGERSAAPADLSAIVMRCLEKDPADRFPSAAAMVDALDGKVQHAAPGRSAATAAQYPAQYSGQQPARTAPGARTSYSPANATERVRWEAPQVRKYRKGMVTWLAFSAAFIPLGMVGDHVFFFIDAMWGIGIASGYAKLWNKGYDWRDVFRQPRDALLADVVNEKLDDARALFDVEKREAARERLRARMRDGRGLWVSPTLMEDRPALPPGRGITGFDAPVSPEVASRYAVVQDAAAARADIIRMMDALPNDDRKQLPDIIASADSLYARMELLAATMHDLDRADVPGMGDAIEREVRELEDEANPLDEEASERRVRRLAQLRRQRISLRDLQKRRDIAAQKLTRCVSAMQSMRLDLSRLATGTRSYQSVTQVAEQAMQLGREVDAVLYAQDEIERTLQRKG
ncbi:MAG: serine/threonine-protein kinase [Gemmatimonadaceae bacterium]